MTDSYALTFKEASKLVGVEPRRIAKGVEDGTIPAIQLGARKVIPRAGLLALFGVHEEPQK